MFALAISSKTEGFKKQILPLLCLTFCRSSACFYKRLCSTNLVAKGAYLGTKTSGREGRSLSRRLNLS